MYNSHIHSIFTVPTFSVERLYLSQDRLGMMMLQHEQIFKHFRADYHKLSEAGSGKKGKRTLPHLQFGVGCIDQPIAQDGMPVLNVGPTVRQDRM